MFRRPGESPSQAAMRNSREQAQANWQRNKAGKYWQDHQKPGYTPLPRDVTPLPRRQSMPSATIREVQAEFDVEHRGIDGMDIYLTFWVSNASNCTFVAAAHFYFAAGKPLVDLNGDYRATDGTVCVWRAYEKRQFYIGPQNIVLFMPYAELHMGSGNHNLGFVASIWEGKGRQLAASDLFPFTLQVG